MKLIKRFILLTFAIICLQYKDGQSQTNVDLNKLTQVLPPAPNAASLGKYGGINVGLSSGTANINVPFFEYVCGGIKLPVSLSYTTSGFKVDEIASRVGIGWSLNAGGVITRTVYGSVDERSRRILPPAGLPQNREMLNFMKDLAGEGGELQGGQGPYGQIDGQPDIFNFNFNGYTGRFILDTNRNIYERKPILLTHSNLKIEQVKVPNADYTFKITTAEGIQYFFNSGDFTSSFNTSIQAQCGFVYDQDVPTAWYLDKIVTPDNDSITFTYSRLQFDYYTGASQTFYQVNPQNTYGNCIVVQGAIYAPNLLNTICAGKLKTNGAILEEINSTSGGKVKFKYVNRNDYNDKLLSSIELYQPAQTAPYRIFNLAYTYPWFNANYYGAVTDLSLGQRPFLMNVIERTPDSSLIKKHSFLYNDFDALPRRLSYAQDHWGYFNGKNNTTMIPTPTNPTFRHYFPNATANREPDAAFCTKGLLSSIVYPTGGKDSIIYEGNQEYKLVKVFPSSTAVTVSSSSSGPDVTSYSSFATLSFEQELTLTGSCNLNTGGDSVLGYAIFTLLDNNNNIIFNKYISDQPSFSFTEKILLGNGSYRIRLSIAGNGSGNGALTYMPGNYTTEYQNTSAGGARVAKVLSYNGMDSKVLIKKYNYSKLSSPQISSGVSVTTPQYETNLYTYTVCQDVDAGSPCHEVLKFHFYAMYSNSITNMNITAFAPTVYSDVIESWGENYENGGVEYQYTVVPDQWPNGFMGEPQPGVPFTNNSHINGQEIYQGTFRKEGVSFIPVKKIFTHYKLDPRVYETFYGYAIKRDYVYRCGVVGTPTPEEWDQFYLSYYKIYRAWTYTDTVRVLTYDNAGQIFSEQKVITDYGNVDHTLPTKVSTSLSDGRSSITNNYYPPDIVLSGNEEIARQDLLARHIISPVLQQQELKNNIQTFKAMTAYEKFPTGMTWPRSKSLQVGNGPIEKRIEFSKYDLHGNLLEQAKKDDAKEVYIWDYQSTYPIAACINADSASVAYTSFEADGNGYWSIPSALRESTTAITGKRAFNLNNAGTTGITNSGLNSSLEFLVSYWSNNASAYTVTGTQGSPVKGRAYNGWYYYEHKVKGLSSIKITGNGLIDELRLHPSDAKMTTYTYEPLIGVTSECNDNNQITYYEYDGLGRLKLVRDQDGKILKRYDYHYQQPVTQ